MVLNRTKLCLSSGRILIALASGFGVLCCGALGCAVGGKSVSVDSNSRIPFFGLELQERQRKSAGPPIHSIRSDGAFESRVEPLGLANLGLAKGKGTFSRLGEMWDRKSPPLPTITLPMTSARRGGDSPAPRTSVEIDFRE